VSIKAGKGTVGYSRELKYGRCLTILGARLSKARMPAFVLGLTILVDGALLPFPDILNTLNLGCFYI
jgi:hypothetical protein